MHIYVDAMGGDNAPGEIVKGAVDAVNKWDLSLTLVGKVPAIQNVLTPLSYPKDAIRILGADEVIGFDEEPVRAVRQKEHSSLVVALEAMKAQSDAVLVSAGSTGALLAGGLFKLGRIKGIKRPAVATPIPKGDHVTLLLDSGANADCRAEYLLQFALLGSVYCQNVMQIAHPKVGLVNIGSEAEKGSTMVKETYALLSQSSLNFIGNVEARDVLTTEADILVTDGFTGNIILKLLEGVSGYLLRGLKDTITRSIKGKIGGALIRGDLQSFKKQFSADEVGGAPFLGIRGGLIKAHGSSDAYAMKNAIHQAALYANGQVLEKITAALSEENHVKKNTGENENE